MTETTINHVRSLINQRYIPNSAFEKFLLWGRPGICPFHVLADAVPEDCNALDIGCGSGIFLNILDGMNKLSTGIGFDASEKAIKTAKAAAINGQATDRIDFVHLDVEEDWPAGEFDVVSMIDVLHHISPDAHQDAIITAASKVRPGGMFIFKDIGTKPLWRAWANRLHDLVLVQEWIHYGEIDDIKDWVTSKGFTIETQSTINMLWYGHKLIIFKRNN